LPTGDGPLTDAEIRKLATHVAAAVAIVTCEKVEGREVRRSCLAEVQSEAVEQIMPLLEEHVKHEDLNLVEDTVKACKESGDDNWDVRQHFSPSGEGGTHISNLNSSLTCASILLQLMSAPGVDRKLVSEDIISSIVGLLSRHIKKHLVPALSCCHQAAIGSNTPNSLQPKMKKGKKVKDSIMDDVFKKLYSLLLSTTGPTIRVMESLASLLSTTLLNDAIIMNLTSISMALFQYDASGHSSKSAHSMAMACGHSLQVSGIDILGTIFAKYTRHRQVLMEDIFPVMLKLPSGKRSLRSYPIRDCINPSVLFGDKNLSARVVAPKNKSDGLSATCIQAITALILTLVHRSVVPVRLKKFENNISNESKKNESRYTSGLGGCHDAANFFGAQLLSRVNRKSEDGGASIFRPILTNIVDDLLAVQLLPEWPASEMVLLALCSQIVGSLDRAGKGETSLEQTYIASVTGVLGKVCSHMATQLRLERESPLTMPEKKDGKEVNLTARPTDDGEDCRCICNRKQLTDTFLLDCDRCHRWFHGSCVGIQKDNIPEMWLCDECTMQNCIVEQAKMFQCINQQEKKDKNIKAEEIFMDRVIVFRQLLLNFLTLASTKSKNMKTARDFHIAKWIQSLDTPTSENSNNEIPGKKSTKSKLVCYHFMNQWNLPSKTHINRLQQLSAHGNAKICRALVAAEFSQAFHQILGFIIKLMGDSHGTLRKPAVKAISEVIKVDPSLMVKVTVRKAVSKCFLDDSISVREAAVTLVGSYVLNSPEVANAFHGSLMNCLDDAGISVRKAACKILRDMVSIKGYKGRTSACTKLLQRGANLKEEDSIRDMIHDIFVELWFKFEVPAGINLASPSLPRTNGANVVTPGDQVLSRRKSGVNSSNVATFQYWKKMGEAAMQMVECVSVLGTSNFLLSFIRGILSEIGGEKDSKVKERLKRKELVESHCANLVASLIEELITREEGKSSLWIDAVYGNEQHSLVALISVLGVFSEVSPKLISSHLDTLLPYLKADNGLKHEEEAILCAKVSCILKNTTLCLNRSDIKGLNESDVAKDLVNITYKFGSSTISHAIESLYALAFHEYTEEGNISQKKIVNLAEMFYKYAYKMKDVTNNFSKIKSSIRTNLHRALTVLGCICRSHGNKGIETKASPTIHEALIDPQSLSWENMLNTMFSLFSLFLKKEDESTKCAAVRAMSSVFIAQPRWMLFSQQAGLLDNILCDESFPSVQHEALLCWKEILTLEEERVESGRAKLEMDEVTSKRISGDQDADASLIGSIINQHSARIYELCTSLSQIIRISCVELLGCLLRQGLINPMEVTPYLLALQGDLESTVVRSKALSLLITEGEKRPEMLRQRICAGVKQSFLVQKQKSSKPTAIMVDKSRENKNVECIFGPIYKEMVRGNKSHRQSLFKNLLGLFDNMSKDDKKKEKRDPHFHLSLLQFVAQVLAHLPFETSTEPLFIIYQISCIVSLKGTQIMDDLASFFQSTQLCMDEDDTNTEADNIEMVLKCNDPAKNEILLKMNDKAFDLGTFSELVASASAITLVLRLKAFLRRVYALSEIRCMEYLPNEKIKGIDKGLSFPDQMPLFNSTLKGFGSKNGSTNAAFHFIEQYSEFRALMRQDISKRNNNEYEENAPLKRKSLSKAKPRNRQSLSKKRKKSDKWDSDESEDENEEEDSEDDLF